MDESLLNFLFLIFFLIVELEFTMIATENPGFYNITDSSGGYVYPLIAQSMILPIVNKPLAALIRMAEDAKEEKKNSDYHDIGVPLDDIQLEDYTTISTARSLEARRKEDIKKVTEKIILPDWEEEKVVALRVHEWPTKMWASYISRIPESLRREREILKGANIIESL